MKTSAEFSHPNPSIAMAPLRGRLRRFLRDGRAASVVEFGLMTPIFLLVLGAAIDFGLAVKTRFNLINAMTSASRYAMAQSAKITSSSSDSNYDPTTYVSNLANLLAVNNGAVWANTTVNANNGPTAAVNGSALTTGGTASNAANFYCPTLSTSNQIVWGSTVSQGSACGSTGVNSGKFVVLTASHAFSPLILPASLFTSPISVQSVVQIQ
jgi:Flp pilus assembly protein TadG